MALTEKIIIAFIGLIGGITGTVFAPWANWGIKKKEIQMQNRKRLLNNCKRIVNRKGFDYKKFRETSYYANIKPFLNGKTIKIMEKGDDQITIQLGGRGGGVNNFKSKILDDIHKIEKKWKLI